MQEFLPYLTLASHIVLAVLLVLIWKRQSLGRWLGAHAIPLALLISILAVLGSLYYSEVIGFEPCVLCWWQRVFLYPVPILLAIALWKKDQKVFRYVVPLVLIAGVIGLYQSYTSLGGASLLPCTASEGDCSKIYVLRFGYITIPLMSLTISLYLLLLAWAHKQYENRHA